MREYIADRKIGKKIYKKCRKNYKRYPYGIAIAIIFAIIILLLNLWLASHAQNLEEVGETLIIGVGFDIPLLFGVALGYALFASGGREMLDRAGEGCVFSDTGFVLEYFPGVREKTEFKCIENDMEYKDIRSVVYDEKRARICITGDYELRQYRTLQKHAKDGNLVSRHVTSGIIYIYAYYPDFEALKQEFKL